MRRARTAAVVVLLAVPALAAVAIVWRAPPPRASLGRDVVVYLSDTGQWKRFDEPGSYDMDVPCSQSEGKIARLHVEITRRPPGGQPPEKRYRQCTPRQVRELAIAGESAQVSFEDVFKERRPDNRMEPAPLDLPDGRRAQVRCAFTTEGGILCVMPEGSEGIGTARAARPGDRLCMKGRVFLLPRTGPCVVLDQARLPGIELRPDEPPWTAQVIWDGKAVITASKPGDYGARVTCAPGSEKSKRIGLRLREFKRVQLDVAGSPVTAELADTPAKTQWGLQGRRGLAPDHGMLFYFPRALRPRFVMKSVSFPLSLAFIRADGRIVRLGRMEPGERRGVRPKEEVNYVLEMEKGWFRERHVKVGDVVTIPRVEYQPDR